MGDHIQFCEVLNTNRQRRGSSLSVHCLELEPPGALEFEPEASLGTGHGLAFMTFVSSGYTGDFFLALQLDM